MMDRLIEELREIRFRTRNTADAATLAGVESVLRDIALVVAGAEVASNDVVYRAMAARDRNTQEGGE